MGHPHHPPSVPGTGEATEPLGQARGGQQQHGHPQEEAPGVQRAGLGGRYGGALHGEHLQGIADLVSQRGAAWSPRDCWGVSNF